jgi:hypothetical protein
MRVVTITGHANFPSLTSPLQTLSATPSPPSVGLPTLTHPSFGCALLHPSADHSNPVPPSLSATSTCPALATPAFSSVAIAMAAEILFSAVRRAGWIGNFEKETSRTRVGVQADAYREGIEADFSDEAGFGDHGYFRTCFRYNSECCDVRLLADVPLRECQGD